VLQRVGENRWLVNNHRADAGAARMLVTQLTEAKRLKTDQPAKLADWGLEHPGTVVKLWRGDEGPIELKIGNESDGDINTVVYVLDPTRPKEPMAVSKTSIDRLFASERSLRDTALLHTAPTDVKTITVSQEGKDTVVLNSLKDRDWEIEARA